MKPKPSLTLMTHPIKGFPSGPPPADARDTKVTSAAKSSVTVSCWTMLNSTLSPGRSFKEDSRRSAGLKRATCSMASCGATVGLVKAILPGVTSCRASQVLLRLDRLTGRGRTGARIGNDTLKLVHERMENSVN